MITRDPEPQTTIVIRIAERERRLVPYVTNAPEVYDGFGTFTVDPGPVSADDHRFEGRLILIESGHEIWQTQRYASGLYAYWRITPEEALYYPVTPRLWARLVGATEEN